MTKKNFNFQKKQQQLEKILQELQDGSLSTDENIKKYHQANKLIDELENYLTTSKNKITKVIDDRAKN